MAKRSSKRTSTSGLDTPAAKQAELWPDRLPAKAPWIALILVTIATVRIVATYPVFGHTVDEGFHIACGLEWITRGTYQIESQHPPLARVLTAIGPWLLGAKLIDSQVTMFDQALSVFYGGDADYDTRLMWARAGVLPAFWLLNWVVWAACARWFNRLIALAAVLLITTLPAVLAHSGLATTDMMFTAAFCAVLCAALRLVEEPGWSNGILFGAALSLALLSKFSSIVFLPACLLAAAMFAWPGYRVMANCIGRALVPGLVGLLLCAGILWAAYRFSWGRTELLTVSVPFPEFFNGIQEVRKHNAEGHDAYVLGKYSETAGFWYYYPVALFFKTPVPFLILMVIGGWVLWRSGKTSHRIPIACLVAVLGVALASRINIGIRHVLPVYVFAAIMAAGAVHYLLLEGRHNWTHRLLLALLAWQLATSAFSHPDYLAYFNLFAGDRPEEILVDSDLDWGQDMKRLGKRLSELGVKEVAFNPALYGFWQEFHGFPKFVPLDPNAPRPGWNAVSLTLLKYTRMATRKKDPNRKIWTDYTKPTERVGKGILLYYRPVTAIAP